MMTHPPANELVLTESRTMRAATVDRTDVLDKVAALTLLPDGIHATTEIVASYYEVGIEAIKSIIKDNRAELEENGYRVLTGAERTEFVRSQQDLTLPPARHLAIFTRRAILNVGQLLTESDIARRVRTYLLDVEETATPEQKVSAVEKAAPSHSAALRGWAAELEAREIAERRVVELEPSATAWDTLAAEVGGDYSVREAAQILDRDPVISTGQNRLFAYIRDLGWIDASGQPYQAQVDNGRLVRRTTSYTNPHSGEPVLSSQVRITAKGLAVLRDRLAGRQQTLISVDVGAA